MTAAQQLVTILSVGSSVFLAIVGVTYKLTRTVVQIESSVHQVTRRLQEHIDYEERAGQRFRDDAIRRMDIVQTDIGALQVSVATLSGRRGNARAT